MPRYRVDPRMTHTVEMKDGTRYHPDRNGFLTVSHIHEHEMDHSKAQHQRGGADLDSMRLLAPPATVGRVCAACAFEGWPWQRVCPKCGGAL
jgi:hypothetical protein